MITFDTHGFRQLAQFLQRYQALLFLILLAVLGRMLPHPDNITPLGAIGLFAGAYLDKRWFLLVPLLAAIISDLLGPGLYNLFMMTLVYVGFMLSALCGRWLLHQKAKLPRLPGTVMVTALVFYLVSNLGPWWTYYEHSFAGFLTCYANALPYLGRSLAGDAMYSLIFFGLYELFLHGQRRYVAHA